MDPDVPSPAPDEEAPEVLQRFSSDALPKIVRDLGGIAGNQKETKKRIQETGATDAAADEESFKQLPEEDEEDQ